MRVYCKLFLLAEHWRRLGAAADDSGWPEWVGDILVVLLDDEIFVKCFIGPVSFENVQQKLAKESCFAWLFNYYFPNRCY